GDEGVALVLGVGEAHHGLVAGERDVDDPADPELHAVVDEVLAGAGQGPGEPPHLVDRDHGPIVHPGSDEIGGVSRFTAIWIDSNWGFVEPGTRCPRRCASKHNADDPWNPTPHALSP